MTRVARYTGPCAAPSISLFHWAPVPEHLSSRNNNKTPAYHSPWLPSPSSATTITILTSSYANSSHYILSSLTLSCFSLLFPPISLFDQAWVPECLWPPNNNKTPSSFTIIHIHHNYNHHITLHHITHTLSRLYLLSNTTLYSITTHTSWYKWTQTDTLSLLANVPTLATGLSKISLQPIIKISQSVFLVILWHQIVEYHRTDSVTLQKADTPCCSNISDINLELIVSHRLNNFFS